MPVRIVISIDTEEDSWGDYRAECGPVENLDCIPALQRLFARYGARPTYLLSYPVATSNRAKRILKPLSDAGECEIGTHCHPWNTPPYEEVLGDRNSMLCNLPNDLVFRKLVSLDTAISDRFEGKPVSFRAGRWGYGTAAAEAIRQLDYLVDSSITPLVDWRGHYGPDFTEAPQGVYRFDTDALMSARFDGSMLEVPPTIGFLQANQELCRRVRRTVLKSGLSHLRVLGILNRLGLLRRRWLSPELATGKEMVMLSKRITASGASVLNMSFHSTSLLPGKGPFVRNKEDLEEFLGRIEYFLRFAREQEMDFCCLRDIPEC